MQVLNEGVHVLNEGVLNEGVHVLNEGLVKC